MAGSRNKLQEKFRKGETASREPSDDAVQWEFGQIQEFDDENGLVKVVMFHGGNSGNYKEIGWHPIRKGDGTIKDLQQRFGKIRKEMPCIVWYRGQSGYPRPGSTFVEIIGEGPAAGGDAIASHSPVPNEKEGPPYQLFSGGLLG